MYSEQLKTLQSIQEAQLQATRDLNNSFLYANSGIDAAMSSISSIGKDLNEMGNSLLNHFNLK